VEVGVKGWVLDALIAVGAIAALLFCLQVRTRGVRAGAQAVRDEAIAAGVAEYRLDSPTNATATFHWRTNR
jgi:hypothetical protein